MELSEDSQNERVRVGAYLPRALPACSYCVGRNCSDCCCLTFYLKIQSIIFAKFCFMSYIQSLIKLALHECQVQNCVRYRETKF